MGKPGALRLLRSCLFFPGRNKRSNKETTIQANLAAAGEDVTGGDIAPVSVSLPEDIIFEVLSRLPVRTLCRLRCVSKAWRALISDPAFAAAQGSRAAAAAPVVAGVFGTPRRLEKFDPPRAPRLPEQSLELRVIDTADGAILKVARDVKSTKLMRARLDLVLIDQGAHGARVIDPATERVLKLSKQLPGEYPMATYDGTSSIGLHTGSCHYSFGRAAPSGVYKVLRLGDARLPMEHGGVVIQICQVATLGDSASMAAAEPVWRQRPEPPVLTCHCSDCVAVVNGVLHFMDRGRGYGSTNPIHDRLPGRYPGWNRIASFDLESEEWKTVIDGPPTGERPKEERWEMVLADLKGTLSVVQTKWSCYHSDVDIWLLVDPENSVWIKRYTIRRPRSWCYFKALDICADGRILMLNSFIKDGQDLLDTQCILQFYDPSTRSLTNLLEMGEDFRGSLTFYTRSLLSQ
ncbi:unnamed protein product [Urochloa humidicola]